MSMSGSMEEIDTARGKVAVSTCTCTCNTCSVAFDDLCSG